MKLTILGTGIAITTKCYNTCFVLHNENGMFLVDGGGGNGIMAQAEKAGIDLSEIHHMFVTHAHTDHILGALWAIRAVAEKEREGQEYFVYGHDVVIRILKILVEELINNRQKKYLSDKLHFVEVKHGEKKEILGMDVTFFDIDSKKAKQFGFSAILTDGRKLCCLGDEPYAPHCEEFAKDSDLIMSEAFCLYSEREKFRPYEFYHSTAKDAGRLAQQLNAKGLLLYHTEDETLDTRKERYTKEAAEEFSGTIYVPDDLEVIEF